MVGPPRPQQTSAGQPMEPDATYAEWREVARGWTRRRRPAHTGQHSARCKGDGYVPEAAEVWHGRAVAVAVLT